MTKLTTYAEEQSARIENEKNSPFVPTHVYEPTGWDYFDPKGVVGMPIASGSKVRLLKESTKSLHVGMPSSAKKMFNVVQDAQGNIQHVSVGSILKITNKKGQS